MDVWVFPFQLKAQSQGSSEELRCLQLINQQQEGSNLEELISNQPCLKLANTIKAYVAMVSTGLWGWGGWDTQQEGSCLPPCISFPIRLTRGWQRLDLSGIGGVQLHARPSADLCIEELVESKGTV